MHEKKQQYCPLRRKIPFLLYNNKNIYETSIIMVFGNRNFGKTILHNVTQNLKIITLSNCLRYHLQVLQPSFHESLFQRVEITRKQSLYKETILSIFKEQIITSYSSSMNCLRSWERDLFRSESVFSKRPVLVCGFWIDWSIVNEW